MVNKEKIIKVEVIDTLGRLIISTKNIEFPKDFFRFSSAEFLVLKSQKIRSAPIGEKVAVVVFYMNGTRIKYETVIDLATESQVNLHLPKDYTVMEERRNYFKTETNLAGVIEYYTHGDEVITFDTPVQVRIKNINIGGVFMMSPFNFDIGDVVFLCIISEAIKISTIIIRRQVNSETGETEGYGCKFEGATATQEESISRYIFECQLAARNKRLAADGRE